MDYPKSVANVGLVNGKFVDENTATGVVGSLIPSVWGNAVTDEIIAVIAAAGISPVEGQLDQLLTAIRQIAQAGGSSYAPDTGTANTYKAAYAPAVGFLTDGMLLRFKAKAANTGGSTFAPDGIPARPIISQAHVALFGGEIVAGSLCIVQYSASLNAWVLVFASAGSGTQGRLIRNFAFDESATYVPGAHVKRIEVEIVGGGGAGASFAAQASGNCGVGGGGGAGGYAHTLIDVTDAMRTNGIPVTIGAGGVAAANTTGGTGGTTSFGSFLSATGGTGGQRVSAASNTVFSGIGGLPGYGAGGSFPASQGEEGHMGMNNNGSTLSGSGGGSAMGYGGNWRGGNTDGNPGYRGGGGGGACTFSSTTAYTGGAGGAGCCVIREYY